jgi:hypothetical protein
MTKQHRATPEQWTLLAVTGTGCMSACILELRARIEALEAAQQPPHQDKLDRLMALNADDGEPIVLPNSSAPEPVAPTDEELMDLWLDGMNTSEARGSFAFARAVLARWGTP